MNCFCLFPLQTHYKITVLKTFPLYWLKTLFTFFALHSTHQRAQHSEGTTRHDARHVAKVLLPNYQNVKSCTALLACKTLWPGASKDSVWCTTETINVDELDIYFHLRKLTLGIALSNCYSRRQAPYGDILTLISLLLKFNIAKVASILIPFTAVHIYDFHIFSHFCRCISVSQLWVYIGINVRSFIMVAFNWFSLLKWFQCCK